MIRIANTEAAFDATVATIPLGSVGYELETNAKGERLIWPPPSSCGGWLAHASGLLGFGDAEAGAGAMLVACRMAGLSALEPSALAHPRLAVI
jgi:hypothetical protein